MKTTSLVKQLILYRLIKNCNPILSVGKFLGVCNSLKVELDNCFRAEKEMKRKENLRKAQEFEKKFDAILTYKSK